MDEFFVGEKVFCRYKKVYYLAEITKISGKIYSVKYPRWGSKWDEEKDKADLMKNTPENKKIVDEIMKKQKSLEKKHFHRKKKHTEDSDSENTSSRLSNSEDDLIERKKKRENGEEEKDDIGKKRNKDEETIVVIFPDRLKQKVFDDLNDTQGNKLIHLPREPSVSRILHAFRIWKLDTGNDILDVVYSGLINMFDRFIGCQLISDNEKIQFTYYAHLITKWNKEHSPDFFTNPTYSTTSTDPLRTPYPFPEHLGSSSSLPSVAVYRANNSIPVTVTSLSSSSSSFSSSSSPNFLCLSDIYGGEHLLRLLSFFPRFMSMLPEVCEDGEKRRVLFDMINSLLIFINEYYDHIFNLNTVNVTSTGGMYKGVNRDRDDLEKFNHAVRRFLMEEGLIGMEEM